MGPLDAYVTAHVGDEELRRSYLVRIDFTGGTVYWTTRDLTVWALGQTWSPNTIALRAIGSDQGESGAGNAAIDIGDADLYVAAQAIAGPRPTGAQVKIYHAYFDPEGRSTAALGTLLIFRGRISRPTTKRQGSVIAGGYELAAFRDFAALDYPGRAVTPKCWVRHFKGLGCHSDGTDTSCDRSFTACSQPSKRAGSPIGGNAENFGGILTLPPDGRTIVWGDGSYTLHAAPRSG